MKSTEIIDRILSLSQADDCIAIVEESSLANVRWANNATTTNGLSTSRTVLVIAIRDRRVGTVLRRYVDEAGLEALVREAESACELREPAEDFAELEGQTETPANWEAPAIATNTAVFKPLIKPLAQAFSQAEAESQRLFGYAEHSRTTTWLANSRGLKRRHDQNKGQIEMTAKTADFAASSWIGQATADFTDVDAGALVTSLRQRLEWSKTKVELPAGLYDTLLQPSAVADLLIYAYWTAAARDADEGRTVFGKAGGGTKLGQQLAPAGVNLYSDPAESGLEVANFEVVGGSSSYASVFDNGVSLSRTNWIEDGKLAHLITPRSWAAHQNTTATPYIDNLIMATPGTKSLEDMIAGVKRGLLVTCLWYIREVDPQRLLLTGLTRDGVFLIEDGQIKGVVNNFRFNMSPVEMLSAITESGATVPTLAREWGDYFTFAKMPPLLIRDFNMSSVSQAT